MGRVIVKQRGMKGEEGEEKEREEEGGNLRVR